MQTEAPSICSSSSRSAACSHWLHISWDDWLRRGLGFRALKGFREVWGFCRFLGFLRGFAGGAKYTPGFGLWGGIFGGPVVDLALGFGVGVASWLGHFTLLNVKAWDVPPYANSAQ